MASWEKVFGEERRHIAKARKAYERSRQSPPGDDPETETGEREDTGEHLTDLFGLALSGGGIRSATFNLGVIQALAEHGLLKKVDYLSTNSGGGYIGSWLSAWVRRSGWIERVEEELKHPKGEAAVGQPEQGEAIDEPKAVSYLRDYSNYLTPKRGMTSADTWVVATTYLRNLLLNLLILFLFMASVILIPHAVLHGAGSLRPDGDFLWAFMILNSVFALVAFGLFHARPNVSGMDNEFFRGNRSVLQVFVVLPVFFLVWAYVTNESLVGSEGVSLQSRLFAYLGLGIAVVPGQQPSGVAAFLNELIASRSLMVPMAYVGFFAGAMIVSSLTEFSSLTDEKSVTDEDEQAKTRFARKWHRPLVVFSALLTALPLGWFAGIHADWINSFENPQNRLYVATVLGVPAMTVVLLLAGCLHLGITGAAFSEHVRQWWSRLGAWFLIYASAWVVLTSISLVGPPFTGYLAGVVVAGVVLGAGWIGTTIGGVVVANRGEDKSRGWFKRALVAAAPTVFVIGALLVVSTSINDVKNLWLQPPEQVDLAEPHNAWDMEVLQHLVKAQAKLYDRSLYPESAIPFAGQITLAALAALLLSLALSWRININDFSLHHFYRERLIRAYLGASRPPHQRKPDRFTHFDPGDDEKLHVEGATNRPYHLLCTALNLAGSDDLDWQERKAASFVFTPKYTGYYLKRDRSDQGDYVKTSSFATDVTYGTAMAISGAAVSPNMGSNTASSLAFLLTIFNVRLGWWIGNPSHYDDKPQKVPVTPKAGLWHLLLELLGMTNRKHNFVYLSDGGHFENMALYELVRRKCRYIICTDCGADPQQKFDDIGNAIRKCRVDLGAEIDIDLNEVKPSKETGLSKWHCAVGAIRYSGNKTGTLVYLRPSLSGDEPRDIENYARSEASFPHQTTADQWFNESQFESYRALGYHVADTTLQPVAEELKNGEPPEKIFWELRQSWYRASDRVTAAFTRHSAALASIFKDLRENDKLEFLTQQIYPEWSDLVAGGSGTSPSEAEVLKQYALPEDAAELRHGFYLCNALIQLMEDVYIDLDLENESDHLDNRGWMNLFEHWTWSNMFRATWAISASTYGARFQRFMVRQLNLPLGRVRVRSATQDLRNETSLTGGFNFEEKRLLGLVQEALSEEDAGAGQCELIEFQLCVPSAQSVYENLLTFNFGFVVSRGSELLATVGEDETPLVRVQSHVRNMGLGRRALSLVRQRNETANWNDGDGVFWEPLVPVGWQPPGGLAADRAEDADAPPDAMSAEDKQTASALIRSVEAEGAQIARRTSLKTLFRDPDKPDA